MIYQNLVKAVDKAEYFEQTQNQDLAQQALNNQKGKIGNYTGEEFRDLYNSFAYPNTEFITDAVEITGDQEADEYIVEKAELRGYERRSAPVQNTFVTVAPNMQLQERAAKPWLDLKNSAEKDGVELFLTAALRSADTQREIFAERLNGLGLTADLILSGQYDDKLDEVLSSVAVPGYSRHHTGYTIDIGCPDGSGPLFIHSECFEWISKNNYQNAKKFGWIPSYPEETEMQGPEPEAWEYVWVGVDALRQKN